MAVNKSRGIIHGTGDPNSDVNIQNGAGSDVYLDILTGKMYTYNSGTTSWVHSNADNQTLSLAGDTLSLTNGGSVDLSAYGNLWQENGDNVYRASGSVEIGTGAVTDNSSLTVYGNNGTASKYLELKHTNSSTSVIRTNNGYLNISAANYIDFGNTTLHHHDLMMYNNKAFRYTESDGSWLDVMRFDNNNKLKLGVVTNVSTGGEVGLYANGLERLSILSNGNIEVGTKTNPSPVPFLVKTNGTTKSGIRVVRHNSNSQFIDISEGDGGAHRIDASSSGNSKPFYITNIDDKQLHLRTNNTSRLILDKVKSQFTTRVQGLDAVNSDEFVTKGQLDNSVDWTDAAYGFVYGFLIKTDIDLTQDAMFRLDISGNSYNASKGAITSSVIGYNYANHHPFWNVDYTTLGLAAAPTLKIFRLSNKLCFWFEQTSSFQTFHFKLKTNTNVGKILSVTNEVMPTVNVTDETTLIVETKFAETKFITNTDSDDVVKITRTAASNRQLLELNQTAAGGNAATTSALFTINNQGSNPYLNFDDKLFMANDGKVGIGITTPTEKLEVNGDAIVGKSLLGTWKNNSDFAVFSHNDIKTEQATKYSLLISPTGTTYINSIDLLRLRLLNVDKIVIGNNVTTIKNNFRLDAELQDKDGNSGTSGQVLSSTATGTNWVSNNEMDITPVGADVYEYVNSTHVYKWVMIGIVSNSATRMSWDIEAFGDNNYPRHSKFNVSVSNYSGNISIQARSIYNAADPSQIWVKVTDDFKVWVKVNLSWNHKLYVRNVVNDLGIPNYDFTGSNLVSIAPTGKFAIVKSNYGVRYDGVTGNATHTYDYVKSIVGGNTVMTQKQNGNVGIGTVNPSEKLDVNGAIKFMGKLEGNGKVAIRSIDPWLRLNDLGNFTAGIYCGQSIVRTDNQLQVGSAGQSFLATMTETKLRNVLKINTNGTGITKGIILQNGSNQIHRWYLGSNMQSVFNIGSSAGSFKWSNSNGDLLNINSNGNVGMGVTNPSEKLQVLGNIKADNLKLSGGVIIDGKIIITNTGSQVSPTYVNNTHYGYVEFKRLDGQRGAFVGYGNGGNTIDFTLDAAQTLKISKDLQVVGKRLDSSGDAGTSGQLLSSTAIGTNWVNDVKIVTFEGVSGNANQANDAAWTTVGSNFVIPATLDGYKLKNVRYKATSNVNTTSKLALQIYSAIPNSTTDGQYQVSVTDADHSKEATGGLTVKTGDILRYQYKASTGQLVNPTWVSITLTFEKG